MINEYVATEKDLSIMDRVERLEDENVGTTNELYEILIEIDMLKDRLKILENLIIGDNK
jgi:uncharacterized protein (UPF0335 family)